MWRGGGLEAGMEVGGELGKIAEGLDGLLESPFVVVIIVRG